MRTPRQPPPAPNAFPFTPTRTTLERVLDHDEEHGDAVIDAGERRAAFERFERLAVGRSRRLGSRLDEGLRWTSGRMTLTTTPVAPRAAEAPEIDRPALAVENAGGLVHLGATFLQGPPAPNADRRITVCSLVEARRTHGALVRRACDEIRARSGDRFAALAAAFANCGAFLHVPAGIRLDAPIQLVWAYPDQRNDAVFPLIVVVVETGAHATIVERHIGAGDPYVCTLVRASVAARGRLDYVALQQIGDGGRMHAARLAHVGEHGRFGAFVAELGGARVRSVVDIRLNEEGAAAQTAALFFNTGKQVVDLATSTDHRAPAGRSETTVRTAAIDCGRGRFVGAIRMRANARGSDAVLRDEALLLSRRARIETAPELAIEANDVRAFHAAAVGSLDADALFYLQSRGIPRSEAARLIALAFFEPAISRFPSDALRDEVRTALDHKIDEASEIDA